MREGKRNAAPGRGGSGADHQRGRARHDACHPAGRPGVDLMVVSRLSDANAAQHGASSIQPQHVAAPAVRTVGWSHGPQPPLIALQALIVDTSPWWTDHWKAVAPVRPIIGAADFVGVRGKLQWGDAGRCHPMRASWEQRGGKVGGQQASSIIQRRNVAPALKCATTNSCGGSAGSLIS